MIMTSLLIHVIISWPSKSPHSTHKPTSTAQPARSSCLKYPSLVPRVPILRQHHTNTCIPCRTGTFNPVIGAGSGFLCLTCNHNTFTDSEGSTRCKPCPEGTVAHRGASLCQACGPGFFLRVNKFQPCKRSQFNDKNAVQLCPFPFTSPKQASYQSQCRLCPPGQFASFPGCGPCFEGTFKAGTLGECLVCPPGSVAKPGSTSCTKCPANTFSGKTFQQKCSLCPEGTTSNGPGATESRPIGLISCRSGTFKNVNVECERCRRNFRYNKEIRMCEPCPAGSVSKSGLQTECTKCPPGQGTFRRGKTCRPCPKGKGGNFVNKPGKNGCVKCVAGTFADEVGSPTCKPCPFGTFAGKAGASSCKKCPPGSVSNWVPTPAVGDNRGSTRCLQITTGCPRGSQPRGDVFRIVVSRRVDFVFGTKEEDIGITCRPGFPGRRLVGDKCKKCPTDSMSGGGVITTCIQCKNGLVRTFFDDSKYTCDGEPGRGKGIQNGACKDCSHETFGTFNSAKCIECRSGSFSRGFGNEFCKICPKGTFADKRGSVACKKCPNRQVPDRNIGSKECNEQWVVLTFAL